MNQKEYKQLKKNIGTNMLRAVFGFALIILDKRFNLTKDELKSMLWSNTEKELSKLYTIEWKLKEV